MPIPDGLRQIAVYLFGTSGSAPLGQGWSAGDGYGNGDPALEVAARQGLFNGAGWDRMYANQPITLLAPAARVATTVTPVQTNFNGRGVVLGLNVTANPGGAETLQLYIDAIDNASGNPTTIAGSGVLFTGGNGTRAFIVYPGATAADLFAGAGAVKGLALPRQWRVQVGHSGAGSWTYSLGVTIVV